MYICRDACVERCLGDKNMSVYKIGTVKNCDLMFILVASLNVRQSFECLQKPLYNMLSQL